MEDCEEGEVVGCEDDEAVGEAVLGGVGGDDVEVGEAAAEEDGLLVADGVVEVGAMFGEAPPGARCAGEGLVLLFLLFGEVIEDFWEVLALVEVAVGEVDEPARGDGAEGLVEVFAGEVGEEDALIGGVLLYPLEGEFWGNDEGFGAGDGALVGESWVLG